MWLIWVMFVVVVVDDGGGDDDVVAFLSHWPVKDHASLVYVVFCC